MFSQCDFFHRCAWRKQIGHKISAQLRWCIFYGLGTVDLIIHYFSYDWLTYSYLVQFVMTRNVTCLWSFSGIEWQYSGRASRIICTVFLSMQQNIRLLWSEPSLVSCGLQYDCSDEMRLLLRSECMLLCKRFLWRDNMPYYYYYYKTNMIRVS